MTQNPKITILNKHFVGFSFEDLIKPTKGQTQVINIINSIEAMMKVYAKEITYSQMRNIYGIIQEAKPPITNLHKARPKIAYIQARQKTVEAKKLVEFIIELMKVVTNDDQLKEFNELMETMVAYHKLFGKK